MRIELFIPSTYEGDIPTDNTLVFEEAVHRFITVFEGCTVKKETSYYYSNKLQKVIKEDVNIIYVFTDKLTAAKQKFLETTAKFICRELKQECVLVVIDDKPIFVNEKISLIEGYCL